ncbi:MAG: toxic anion resistance protein, partial [Jatrophihabitans endophyticus]
MSELDLNAAAAPAATTTAAPAQAPGGLVLTPPAPVSVVKDDDAAGAVPVDDAKKTELAQRAAAFANELAAMDPHNPEFTKKVDAITSMGDKE